MLKFIMNYINIIKLIIELGKEVKKLQEETTRKI